MTESTGRLSTALADRYRIESHLGEGGMATVYLAEDLKHERKVAVKVLRPELAAVLGAERFVQEIKTTAALQHPHILPLHDSGNADGFLYYVMPFIDGETLRDKLNRETQLGIDEAVRITTEIADALDYAHRQNVIHRDIKPENILLHDGRPMVADFGIALAVSAAAGGRMTETGLSLGTPHYMSPEQATAEKELTNRSDIYALGSVLYEMLAGNPPHVGASAQQIIMKIVTEEAPPVTTVRKSVPPNVTAAVSKSLEKLPADRFESARAFADALVNPGFAVTVAGSAAPSAFTGAGGVPRPIFAATAVVAVVALVAAGWGWSRSAPPAGVSRSNINLWRAKYSNVFMETSTLVEPQAAISPDGSMIVFSDSTADGVELRRKRREDSGSEPIPGGIGGHAPFFSPDGAWIGFSTADGRIRKMPASGGGAIDVVNDASSTWLSAAWLDDGTIVYLRTRSDIGRVDADGGPGREVVSLAALFGRGVSHMWPLPGSRGVLITDCPGNCVSGARVAVVDLRTDSVRTLIEGAAGAWYAPTGHLLYTLPEGGLYAAEFDSDALEFTGGAVPVIDGVTPAEFTLSRVGTILYSTGGATTRPAELVWVTRRGSVESLDVGWRGDFMYPALSPDGRSLAVSVAEQTTQLWLRRPDGSRQKLTLDGQVNWRPSWSADGRTIAFSGLPTDTTGNLGDRDGFAVPADGSGVPRTLLDVDVGIWEVEYSRDGRWLVNRQDDATVSEIHARRLDGDSTQILIVGGRGQVRQPALSPDSRWLAYVSSESGRNEVYVISFPDGTSKRLMSQSGGLEPRWSADGRELFFKSGGALMVVDIPPGPALAPGVPRPLFSVAGYRGAQNRQQYDVAPDGRFVMIRDAIGETQQELVYAENWFEELRAKVGN